MICFINSWPSEVQSARSNLSIKGKFTLLLNVKVTFWTKNILFQTGFVLLALYDVTESNYLRHKMWKHVPHTCCFELMFVWDSQSEESWL